MCQKHFQCCWELHGQLWEALSGTAFDKKRRPQPHWGGDNSGNAPEASNALELGFGVRNRTLEANSRKSSESISRISPEFLPEIPTRTWGMGQCVVKVGQGKTLYRVLELQSWKAQETNRHQQQPIAWRLVPKVRRRSTTTEDRNLQFGHRLQWTLHWIFKNILQWIVPLSPGFLCSSVRRSPPNLEKITRFPGGEKNAESCHVSGYYGFCRSR